MSIIDSWARSAALIGCAIGLAVSTPATAGRSIQIDVATQSNTLSSCSNFAGCQRLSLDSLGTSIFGVAISPTGYIQLLDGHAGGGNFFHIASSDVGFQVLSGYTNSPSLGRIDFVDFFRSGRNIDVLPSGNRPSPDFQIQLRRAGQRGPSGDLEIAFAYADTTPQFGNHVEPGAQIGYSGATLGQTGPSPISTSRTSAQRFVTNANGLLLGTQPTDSDFVFVVGDYLLIENGNVRDVTTGLVSERFEPRFAAVPEPASWAMMVLGFGAAGAGLRRRRYTVASAA